MTDGNASMAHCYPDTTGPVAWMVERQCDPTFPRLFMSHADATALLNYCNVGPLPTMRPLYLGVAQGAGHPVREALSLAREYISQDHGGFKEGDGYFEQTGEILKKLDAALSLSSTHSKSPALDWKLDRPECPRCKGQGRVGVMACNDCGATGVLLPSTDGASR